MFEKLKYSGPIMDIHLHTGRPDLTLILVEAMDFCNIKRAAILATPLPEHGWVTSEGISALVKSLYPERFILFATVDLRGCDEKNWGEREAYRLEENVENGAQGIKLRWSPGRRKFPWKDMRMNPIYDKCAELNIPVLIHVWAHLDPRTVSIGGRYRFLFEAGGVLYDPDIQIEQRAKKYVEKELEEFKDVLRVYPDANFIAAHCLLSTDLKFLSEMLWEFPNLYLDTSGLMALALSAKNGVKKARKFFTEFADRMVYGRDLMITFRRFSVNDFKQAYLLSRLSLEGRGTIKPRADNLEVGLLDLPVLHIR